MKKMTNVGSLRIIFAGTPEFSVPTLQTLLEKNFNVIAVYTQPDRPAGRGQQLTMSPVKQIALKHNIPVFQPQTLKDEKVQQQLINSEADVMVVVAYGLILPKIILQAPTFGCLNVHASLLPRWRGAAPIQRAIEAGDKETGVTIMQMDEGLDTGDMLGKEYCKISPEETAGLLHDRLAQIGAEALIKTLGDLQKNQLHPVKQDNAQANYARKIEKADAKINWSETAEQIVNRIRAFNPWPVCFTQYGQQPMRIWQAVALNENPSAQPGEIVAVNDDGIDVATRKGIVRLQQIQLAGGKALSVSDFLKGHRSLLQVGSCFV